MDHSAFIAKAKKAGYDEGTINKFLAQWQPKATPSPNQTPITSWKDFVGVASKMAKEQNFPLGVLLGQAALESARGTSAPGNNFFGIKAVGNQPSGNYQTSEYGPGGYYSTPANFVAYSSPQESINAYINLIKNSYGIPTTYQSDPNMVLQAIKAKGYATSPTYVQDVENTPEYRAFSGGANGS